MLYPHGIDNTRRKKANGLAVLCSGKFSNYCTNCTVHASYLLTCACTALIHQDKPPVKSTINLGMLCSLRLDGKRVKTDSGFGLQTRASLTTWARSRVPGARRKGSGVGVAAARKDEG